MAVLPCAIAEWPCPWPRRRISGASGTGRPPRQWWSICRITSTTAPACWLEVYGGGKRSTEVIVYTIEGGGHTWPGGPQYLPVLLVGKASPNLDATETIWGFFKEAQPVDDCGLLVWGGHSCTEQSRRERRPRTSCRDEDVDSPHAL